MMKKLLLSFFSVLLLCGFASAQCVIDGTKTTPGYYPDSATGLKSAVVTVPYVQVVQVRVLKDTTSPAFPGQRIPINYVQMDSVTGLPSGFTYTTNPASGKFPGNSNGCIQLTGTATAGMEAGGPKNNGVYPLIVYYHANAQVPVAGPTNIPGSNKKYHLTVLPASAGIATYSGLQEFNVYQNIPNPTSGLTDIQFWVANAGNVQVQLYNVLGALVHTKNIAAEYGNNKYTLDTSVLTPGIYLYSFKSGNKTVSKRMIVSAH